MAHIQYQIRFIYILSEKASFDRYEYSVGSFQTWNKTKRSLYITLKIAASIPFQLFDCRDAKLLNQYTIKILIKHNQIALN